jgi:tripartite-type tricarboxylate transporter receptor subunit TctC
MRRRTFLASASAVVLAPCLAVAQDRFPSRPITLLVPFDAGGGPDLQARAAAPVLDRLLGQPVAVLNRPGAGGGSGLSWVLQQARADGHTIAASTLSIVTIPEVDRLYGRPPRFTIDQFAPLALLSTEPLVIVVHATSPWQKLGDLVDAGRGRPNAITYSAGNYGPSHVAAEAFAGAANVRFLQVPYPGPVPSLNALLSGTVDFSLSPPSLAAVQMRARRLRALAVTSVRRHPELPDVPTLREAGLDVEAPNWYGLFAAAATPPEALAALRAALDRMSTDPQFLEGMAKIRAPVDYRNAADFAAFLAQQKKLLAATVQRIGKVE